MYNLQNQTGTSLLEVLISIVVVSIGLLGLAALQANAVRYNHSAQLRSIATAQAHGMADRLRANDDGVSKGYYNNISGIPQAPGCTTCTSDEIAKADAFQWNTTNAALLPSGQGTITSPATDRFIITVRWDNSRSGVTGLACSGNEAVDLACVQMEVQL